MDFVLQGLKRSNDINLNNVDSVVNSNLNLFYKSKFTSSLMLQSALKYSNLECNRLSKKIQTKQKISAFEVSPIQKVINEYSANLSDLQKEFLNRIDNAMYLDEELIVIELNKIEIDAQSKLSEQEALPILAGIEIGKASIAYWTENLNSWIQALNSNSGVSNVKMQKVANKFSWNNLFASDTAGGVGAAVGAAIVNAIPGAGQIAYGGAIIGGAAGGSATYAVYEIFAQ